MKCDKCGESMEDTVNEITSDVTGLAVSMYGGNTEKKLIEKYGKNNFNFCMLCLVGLFMEGKK